jgi:hypothetical protein
LLAIQPNPRLQHDQVEMQVRAVGATEVLVHPQGDVCTAPYFLTQRGERIQLQDHLLP